MPVKVGLQYIEQWKDSMENYVRRYEQEPVVKDQIVFYGPSYYTRWSERWEHRPLREELVGKSGAACCINRGFGSSNAEHQLYYYHRMIRPLKPNVLVYCCHGNHAMYGYSVEECWELGQRVIAYAMNDFPELRVYIQSAHPGIGISNEEITERRRFNSYVREFAETTPGCFYVDVFERQELWDPGLFVSDNVHFNYDGYKLYGNVWREALKNELEKY